MTKKIRTIFYILIIVIYSSCNSPETIKPQFTKPDGYVTKELKTRNNYEEVRVRWGASRMGDVVVHYLKLELINGKDLPKDDSSLNVIGKDAMNILLNSINNKTDYSKITVVFVKEIKKGSIKYTETIPFKYELEEYIEIDTISNEL